MVPVDLAFQSPAPCCGHKTPTLIEVRPLCFEHREFGTFVALRDGVKTWPPGGESTVAAIYCAIQAKMAHGLPPGCQAAVKMRSLFYVVRQQDRLPARAFP